jgi:HEAT repeat protein
MVQLIGRELLVSLYLTDDARLRLELIDALRDIKYSDALPTLRRLAGEDRDAKVRAGAVAALEKMSPSTRQRSGIIGQRSVW